MAALGPEAKLQTGVVRLVRGLLLPPGMVWWCPNGQFLSTPARRSIAVAQGLLPGMGDLHFVWQSQGPQHMGGNGNVERYAPSARFGVIEMKEPGWKPLPSDKHFAQQKAVGDQIVACGHRWDWANSIDRMLEILAEWGVPMRTMPVGHTLKGQRL